MTPRDTTAKPTTLLAEGRVVYQCAECSETFETGRDLLHVTCPACGTNAVDVVANV